MEFQDMDATARNIVCAHCQAVNRVPGDRDPKQGKCGRCGKPLFEGHPFATGGAAFDKQIDRSDVPVVVDFWADWCGPCKMMAPAYEQVALELEPNFRFLKVDTEAEQALAARYNIRSIPTLMVFRHGAILAQRAGALDRNSLRAWLTQIPVG
ncbi:Thioredoxin 2 [Methylocella tundrae]|nr:Thioredoxin 2 [Methylocella tundrae]